MRAKYKGKVRDENGYAVHLFYEYKGHEYIVTDEHNGYSETMWEKHRDAQKRIDREIEEERAQGKQDSKPFDMDEIFQMMGWD
jgi:ubiquitin